MLDREALAALDPEVRAAVFELDLLGFHVLTSGGGRPGIPAHVDIVYHADIDPRDVVAEATRLHNWAIDSPLWPYANWVVNVHLTVGVDQWCVSLSDTTDRHSELV